MGNLIRHKRVHTGEKTFSCEVCQKKFSQTGNLTTHMRVHTGEKPFSCEVCQKKFSQTCNLTTHMRVHTGEKPFSCEVCQKKFSQTCNLTTHMRVHTGEKPFSCDGCQKKFSMMGNLRDHMRVHTGEKPFSCDGCQKKFSQTGNLTFHKRVVTCFDCKEKMACIGLLRLHRETVRHTAICQEVGCGQEFNSPRQKYRHFYVKHKSLPCSYEECSEGFKGYNALRAHRISAHVPTPCSGCDQSYFIQSNHKCRIQCNFCFATHKNKHQSIDCMNRHVPNAKVTFKSVADGAEPSDWNNHRLVGKMGSHFVFRDDIVGFTLACRQSILGLEHDIDADFKDSTLVSVTPDVKVLGQSIACIVAVGLGNQVCPRVVIESYTPDKTPSNRPSSYKHSDSDGGFVEHKKIRVPAGFNVGHLATSCYATNQVDKNDRNIIYNLVCQDEYMNKNVCKNIEMFMMNKANTHSELKEAIVQTIPVLLTDGNKMIEFDQQSNLVIPLFIVKQLFLVSENGKFEVFNFLIPNVPAKADFMFFQVTLSALEKLLKTMRFLNSVTYNASLFTNMDEQMKDELPRAISLSRAKYLFSLSREKLAEALA